MLECKSLKSFDVRIGGICLLLNLILTIVFIILLSMFNGIIPETIFLCTQLVLGHCLSLGLILVFKSKYKDLYLDGDIFDRDKDTFDIMNIIFAFIAMLCVYFIAYFVSMFFSIILVKNDVSDMSLLNLLSEINPLVGWFMLAVLPATTEELFYRGLIYNATRKRGVIFSMFVTTFSFSLTHFDVGQAVYTFIFGIVLFLLRDITKSIYPGMVAHLFFNSITVFLMYRTLDSEIKVVIPEKSVGISHNEFLVSGIISIVCICVLFLLFRWLIKYNKYNIDKNVDKKQPGLTFSYIITYVICCLFIIVSI